MSNVDRILINIKNKERKGPKLVICDYKELYEDDIDSNLGFDITDKKGIVNGKERTEGGIYSPKFGTTWDDGDEAFQELHSCKCGQLKGGIHEGEICPECDSKVVFTDTNINKFGWLKLERYYLIHPTLYKFIESIIGSKSTMENIISSEIIKTKKKKIKLDKYSNIGMIEFKENFEEILDYYYSKKKHKKYEYQIIKDNIDKVFIQHVPVFTLLLRPIKLTDQEFKYGDINSKYITLTNKIFSLNKDNLILDKLNEKILPSLFKAQTMLMKIYNMCDDMLSRKEGQIRGSIMGTRYNFSARNVIIPLRKCKINEIELPYLTFIEIFRPEIINIMMKIDDITIAAANERWTKATLGFDKKVYKIMKYILKHTEGGVKVLINRPPSIDYGSILCMKIKDVKSDYNDFTMGVPINILGAIKGDFDGDVLAIFSLKGWRFIQGMDNSLNPRENMLISVNDGKFNNSFNLIKDQIIALHYFCQMSRNKPFNDRIKITCTDNKPKDRIKITCTEDKPNDKIKIRIKE